MTTQSKSLRLADQLAREPFAWPGGYPLFAVTSDGFALCSRCCSSERESIATTTGNDGWNIIALEINWEEPDFFCSHCSRPIDPAYSTEEA